MSPLVTRATADKTSAIDLVDDAINLLSQLDGDDGVSSGVGLDSRTISLYYAMKSGATCPKQRIGVCQKVS